MLFVDFKTMFCDFFHKFHKNSLNTYHLDEFQLSKKETKRKRRPITDAAQLSTNVKLDRTSKIVQTEHRFSVKMSSTKAGLLFSLWVRLIIYIFNKINFFNSKRFDNPYFF